MTVQKEKQESVLGGGFWTVLSRILTQLTQFAIFMVAVRLLTPAEFGVFALAAAVVVILTQASTAGWPEYIMQWHGDISRIRQTLCIAMICGFAIAALGNIVAGIVGAQVDEPSVRQLIQILSISVFFTSVGAAYNGVLIRKNRLTSAALITLLADVANLIVAVWTLFLGYGVLALAWGRLVSAIVWSVSGVLVSKTLPSIAGAQAISDAASFSWKIILTRIVINVRIYAATLIIGGFLGVTSAGFFRAAQRVVTAFEEIVSEPTRVLSWNLFRRSRDDHAGSAGFGALALTFFPILYYGAVPLFVGVILMADTLTAGLLGPGWEAATPVLRILAVAALIRCSGHASVGILTLAGQIRIVPWFTALYAVIAITAVLAASSFGIIAIAASEVVAAAIAFMINAVIAKRYAGISWPEILRKTWRVLPALAIACLPVILANSFDLLAWMHDLVRFVVLGLVMMLFFVPTILFLDKSLWAAVQSRQKPAP